MRTMFTLRIPKTVRHIIRGLVIVAFLTALGATYVMAQTPPRQTPIVITKTPIVSQIVEDKPEAILPPSLPPSPIGNVVGKKYDQYDTILVVVAINIFVIVVWLASAIANRRFFRNDNEISEALLQPYHRLQIARVLIRRYWLFYVYFGLTVFTVLVLGNSSASSQEQPIATGTPQTQIEVVEAPKVDLKMLVPETTELPVEPVELDLSLRDLPGKPSDIDINGAVMKAFIRKVEYEGTNYGQLVIYGVEKEGKIADLDQADFAHQWTMEQAKLDQGEQLIVPGDGEELIEALRSLQEEGVEPEQQESNPVASQSGSDGSAGGDGESFSYSNPDPLPAKVEEASAVISVSSTIEGCPVRIDEVRQVAIQQSRSITYENGTPTNESECSDSFDEFPIQRSYSVCGDLIDTPALTATAQYEPFYVNAQAERVSVGDCTPDTEQVFQITENHNACTVSIDRAGMTATPRATLTYLNQANVETEVRVCDLSVSKAAVPLVEDAAACSIRHDFAGATSYQQSMLKYTLEELTYQATQCSDSDTTFPHVRMYKDAGDQDICTTIINDTNTLATKQYRLSITIDGQLQYIGECTPDETSLAVTQTPDTCTDPSNWTHDLTAGVSYDQIRHYYLDGGNRVYVNDCQTGTTVYPHDYEVVSWENNDAQLYAYPRKRVTIYPPSGDHTVETSALLPGETQQPYTYLRQSDEWTGVSNFTPGTCEEYRPTARSNVYQRPDGTEYANPIGTGDTLGPFSACTSVVRTPVWEPVHGTRQCQLEYGTADKEFFRATYVGKRTLLRSDGVTIEQTSVNQPTHRYYTHNGNTHCAWEATGWAGRWGSAESYCNAGHRSNYPQCLPPDPYFNNSWNIAEGW